MLQKNYKTYQQGLNLLGLETLNDWRENMCLTFAIKSSKNPKTKHMFPQNDKTHCMDTRNCDKFKVQHAHNERLKNSSIIFMQNLLNQNDH